MALAKLGQAVETDFVGAPIGIMDQMASSLAGVGEALFLDTRTLATEPVALPAGAELVVINSGVAHHHAHGDYRTRRAECERAASLLGVAAAARRGRRAISRGSQALPSPLDRRARHVVTENQRVLDAVAAMRAGDAAALGALFDASHASQRDDYECSVPEVDQLVEIAQADAGGLRRAAHRRRLRRVDRRAGSGRRGRRRRRARGRAYARLSDRHPTVLVP